MANLWSEQLSVVAAAFDTMRRGHIFTDVTLVCGGRSFPVHRSFICAASPYLRSLLQPIRAPQPPTPRMGRSTAQPRDRADRNRIVLNVNPEALDALLDFLYTGSLPEQDWDVRRLKDLVTAAHTLQMWLLVNHCLRRLRERLSVDSFLEVWQAAQACRDAELLDAVPAYLACHFSALAASNDFVKLTSSRLRQLLAHPDLREHASGDMVVKSILIWAKHKERERGDELDTLLALVDGTSVSKQYVAEIGAHEPLVRRNPKALRILKKASRSATVLPSAHLVCFGRHEDTNVVRTFYVPTRTWSRKQTLDLPPTAGMAVTLFDGCIYLLGGSHKIEGSSKEEPTTSVYCYDTKKETMKATGNLIAAVYHSGAGCLRGWIYVVGGVNIVGTTLKLVQRFNPATGECEEMASTHEAHNRPQILVDGRHLYAVGSCGETESSVERYARPFNQWTILTRVPEIFDSCRAALLERRLFVVRRRNELRLHVFDLVQGDKWETREWVGEPSQVTGLWAAGENCLLVRDGHQAVHVYNVAHGTWTRISEGSDHPWTSWQTVIVNASMPTEQKSSRSVSESDVRKENGMKH